MENLKGFDFFFFNKLFTIGFMKYDKQLSLGLGFHHGNESSLEIYIDLIFWTLCLEVDSIK